MSESADKKTRSGNWFLPVLLLQGFLCLAFFEYHAEETGIALFGSTVNPASLSGIWIGITACLYLIHKQTKQTEKIKISFFILGLLVSLLFSTITLAGKFYADGLSFRPAVLFSTAGNAVRTGLALLGGTILYWYLIKCVYLLCRYLEEKGDTRYSKWIRVIVDSRLTLILCAVLIGLFWLPQIIIRYPGAVVYDVWKSLYHYWNPAEWTTQHPVIFTLILGKAADFGIARGDFSFGIFMIVLAQVISHLLVMGYSIKVMRDYSVRISWRIFTLLFYMILPTFSALATTTLIDSGYCVAFLLLLTEMVICLYNTEKYVRSPVHWILTILAIAGMYLRYNGWYVMLVTCGGLLVWAIIVMAAKKVNWKAAVIVLCLFAIPTVSMQGATKYLTNHYAAIKISTRAKFAMPIQHTARCVKTHPKSFTEEDKEVLAGVMDWSFKEIGEKYSPYTFDTLKTRFRSDASSEELKAFLKLWLKMVRKHPGTCLNATLQQNYFLFSLFAENTHYYSSAKNGIKTSDWDYSDLYQLTKEQTSRMNKVMHYYDFYNHIPVINVFVNQAVYTLILAVLTVMALVYGKRKNLVLYLPLLATVGIVLVGPACKGHPRYTYPLFYAMPLIIAVAAMVFRKTESIPETEPVYAGTNTEPFPVTEEVLPQVPAEPAIVAESIIDIKPAVQQEATKEPVEETIVQVSESPKKEA